MSEPSRPSRRELIAGAAALTAASPHPSPRGDARRCTVARRAAPSSSPARRAASAVLARSIHARLGAKVIATMRNVPRPEAETLAAEALKDKLDLHIVEIDVTDDASVKAGTARALELAGGRIDTLVNNAGIGITGPVEVQDMEATRLIFETNVIGIQRMLLALLPQMRARETRADFQCLVAARPGDRPGGGHYSATKFAVEALSEQLAYELVPHGIEVTVIQPGGYPTRVWQNRNIYTGALKDRSDAALLAAYQPFTKGMGSEDGSGRSADPADVPRAIAEIMAMPAGASAAPRASTRDPSRRKRSTRSPPRCRSPGSADLRWAR